MEQPTKKEKSQSATDCLQAIGAGVMITYETQRVGQFISNAVAHFKQEHPELWNSDDSYYMPNDLFALALREYAQFCLKRKP